MSWHFSQAMEAAFSEASCWDGEPSAPSKLTRQPDDDSSPAKTTAACHHSPSGTTFPPLTASPGLALWMSSLAASRARTSASPERGQGLPASDQGSGVNLLGSFARFDPATSSWKTPQLSLLGGSEQFSETWPRWGLMRDGVCWAQSTPAHLIGVSGSGLWLTPCATDAKPITGGDLFQTSSGSVRHRRPDGSCSNRGLAAQVNWPTPTVCGNHNRKGASPTSGDGLATAVSKEGCSGGPLNPEWVELLMGWPIGWTDLNPISPLDFSEWLMGFGSEKSRRNGEAMCLLRDTHGAQAVQQSAGGSVSISEAPILLSDLCQHTNQPHETWLFMEGQEAPQTQLRSVRNGQQASSASHKSSRLRQSPREHSDTMQAMPRLLAHYGQEAWQDGSWENAVPRMSRGVANRVDRLRGLGNGQVPAVVALAWETLTTQPDLFASAGPVA